MQPKSIGNHGNKFTVSRFASCIVDGVSEIGIQDIHIASVPGVVE